MTIIAALFRLIREIVIFTICVYVMLALIHHEPIISVSTTFNYKDQVDEQ